MGFLRYIRQWGKKVVFLVNKADILASQQEQAEVCAFVADAAARMLGVQGSQVLRVCPRYHGLCQADFPTCVAIGAFIVLVSRGCISHHVKAGGMCASVADSAARMLGVAGQPGEPLVLGCVVVCASEGAEDRPGSLFPIKAPTVLVSSDSVGRPAEAGCMLGVQGSQVIQFCPKGHGLCQHQCGKFSVRPGRLSHLGSNRGFCRPVSRGCISHHVEAGGVCASVASLAARMLGVQGSQVACLVQARMICAGNNMGALVSGQAACPHLCSNQGFDSRGAVSQHHGKVGVCAFVAVQCACWVAALQGPGVHAQLHVAASISPMLLSRQLGYGRLQSELCRSCSRTWLLKQRWPYLRKALLLLLPPITAADADARLQVFPISARTAMKVKLEATQATHGGNNGKQAIFSLWGACMTRTCRVDGTFGQSRLCNT